jgi:hypothetical protein
LVQWLKMIADIKNNSTVTGDGKISSFSLTGDFPNVIRILKDFKKKCLYVLKLI